MDEVKRSWVYLAIVSRIKELYYTNGTILSAVSYQATGMPDFLARTSIVFQKRPRFEHNYQRDRFFEEREIYVRCDVYNILAVNRKDDVATINLADLRVAFGDEWEEYLQILTSLLENFFTVKTKARNTVKRFDASNEGYENNGQFTLTPPEV